MKRLISSIIAAALALCLAGAQGRIETHTLRSEILKAGIQYNVYLPEGYNPANEYPVIYLLHGLYGCYSDWDKRGHMREVADKLIASGELVPAVILMPTAGDEDVHNVQNGYFNVVLWPYEDFFFKEFMPQTEKKYNCGGSKGMRAIMGLSMGGGGSIVYAQRHPELFSSSYGMSAWLDSKGRADRENLPPTDKLYIVNESVKEHSALDFIDNAEPKTVEALRTVKWFLDCGDDDYLLELSMSLHMKMRKAGIQNELRVRDGGHTWEYWNSALWTALPFASKNFYANPGGQGFPIERR